MCYGMIRRDGDASGLVSVIEWLGVMRGGGGGGILGWVEDVSGNFKGIRKEQVHQSYSTHWEQRFAFGYHFKGIKFEKLKDLGAPFILSTIKREILFIY